MAGLQELLARASLDTLHRDVLPRRRWGEHENGGWAEARSPLDRHHRIPAGRHGGTRHDAHGASGWSRTRVRRPRYSLTHHIQRGRRSSTRARHVGGTYRVAIHRGAIEGGHVAIDAHGPGQDAARRFGERDLFHTQRLERRLDRFPGAHHVQQLLVHGHHSSPRVTSRSRARAW